MADFWMNGCWPAKSGKGSDLNPDHAGFEEKTRND